MTLRASPCVPSLRASHLAVTIENALAAANSDRFRVLHFSVLLAEADGPTEFERGIHGLAIRVAKAVNRTLGRTGRVWADRYHARMLRTPREVRNALRYVLLNARHHAKRVQPSLRSVIQLDPASSASWFDGWKLGNSQVPGARERPATHAPSPVARAKTWLLNVGWRRYGLLNPTDVPG